MKHTIRSVKKISLVLTLMLCMAIGSLTAFADPFNKVAYTDHLVIRGGVIARTMDLPKLKGYKNLKVSCSNKKVSAEVFPPSGDNKVPSLVLGFRYVDSRKNLVYLNSGKALIKVSGVKNGKKKTLRINVNLEKGAFINPFKSFKIGSMELKKSFNKGNWWRTYPGTDKLVKDENVHTPDKMMKKISGKKLKLQIKKDWEILSIEEQVYTQKGTDPETGKTRSYKLSNGSRLPVLPKIRASVYMNVNLNVLVRSTKTGLQEEFRISVL